MRACYTIAKYSEGLQLMRIFVSQPSSGDRSKGKMAGSPSQQFLDDAVLLKHSKSRFWVSILEGWTHLHENNMGFGL